MKISIISLLIISLSCRLDYCPWGNSPVCGVDSKTYPNQCALAGAYVELRHMGACRISRHRSGEVVTNCSQVYEPVCGRDGVTYLNECRLEVNKTVVAFHGPCANPNFIPHKPALVCNCLNAPFQPVCSLGGENYENECVLNCTQQIAQSVNSPCEAPCDCPKKYQPVCGVDGFTYDNKCTLNCVKVLKQGNGECASLLRGCEYCSDVFMPVCGALGKTFRNLCELKCNGSRFDHFGKCDLIHVKKTTCDLCSSVHMPICGTDGVNYQNECMCTCGGNCQKYSEGRCPTMRNDSCSVCRGQINLGCGEDGVTYDNSCFAECAGVRLQYNGACNRRAF